MADLHTLSATDMAAGIANGSFTSEAVVTDCLKPADESWALAMLKPEHRWEFEGDDG